ncbi:GTP cyclohydrolase MptA [Staphylothermus hellenicus]|nr:GTP cyclohydrolase MptA [Staphylothermus hellenicus]
MVDHVPLPEIQDSMPEHPLSIDRVGIRGVRRRINIYSPIGVFSYDARIDIYVDLPSKQRGIHLSRSLETVLEALEEARVGRFKSLETLFENVCKRLLSKHGYATKAEVVAETTYFYEEEINGKTVQEPADIVLHISVWRDGKVEWSVGASIYGMTVCPSAQLAYSTLEGTPLHKSPSHSQRAKLKIVVKTSNRVVRIEWLIEAMKEAFSSPTHSLLKRIDEYKVIKEAFEKPRFVEDIVRYATYNIAAKLAKENFPPDTRIMVEAESYESIHPYNVYASRDAFLSDIINEISNNKV